MQRLRDTITRAASHGIRTILCLEYGSAGYQYHASRHVGVTEKDVFASSEALRIYPDLVRGVVEPLRGDPAVLGWTVTNEPVSYLGPSPAKLAGWRSWLKAHALAEDTPPPTEAEWKAQSTPAASAFLDFDLAVTADALIARARLIKAADRSHLISISDTLGRALRGHAGAELFDFWAPHTYDLWLNGPPIDRHVAFLVALHRDTLPDRPRPVMIEEFGIQEKPEYPEAMRAEHIRQFVAAGQRHGLAGLMHWWEMTGAQFEAFGAKYHTEPEPPGPVLAAWLPRSQEWNLLFYDRYMTRRGWDAALATAAEAGLRIRVVSEPSEARGAAAMLVLGDALPAAEAQTLPAAGCPVCLLPSATPLPDATVLPQDPAAQSELWRKVARP
ncbi:MAG: hypothetical protein HYU66_19680 [Armatimonadetes bacterium]|nr:hypothetical protein [Armatimonadota bacterium]